MIDLWSIATAVGTFAAGIIYQAHRSVRAESLQQLNDLIAEVRTLQDLCATYWTRDRCADDGVLEVKIRGSCMLISAFAADEQSALGSHASSVQAHVDELIDLSSGGSFETKGKVLSVERAVEIRASSAKIISSARKARMDAQSVPAILRDIYLDILDFLEWVGRNVIALYRRYIGTAEG